MVVTGFPGHRPDASTSAIVSRAICSCCMEVGKIAGRPARAVVVALAVEGRGVVDLEEIGEDVAVRRLGRAKTISIASACPGWLR